MGGRIVVAVVALVALAAVAQASGAADRGASTTPGAATSYGSLTIDPRPVPPAPRVVATRIEQRVRIAYSFSVWPSAAERRPVVLLTAVQSSGTRYGPLHKEHNISKRSGVVSQQLGLGNAPFKLYAAAYSQQGRSSKTVVVPVWPG